MLHIKMGQVRSSQRSSLKTYKAFGEELEPRSPGPDLWRHPLGLLTKVGKSKWFSLSTWNNAESLFVTPTNQPTNQKSPNHKEKALVAQISKLLTKQKNLHTLCFQVNICLFTDCSLEGSQGSHSRIHWGGSRSVSQRLVISDGGFGLWERTPWIGLSRSYGAALVRAGGEDLKMIIWRKATRPLK